MVKSGVHIDAGEGVAAVVKDDEVGGDGAAGLVKDALSINAHVDAAVLLGLVVGGIGEDDRGVAGEGE